MICLEIRSYAGAFDLGLPTVKRHRKRTLCAGCTSEESVQGRGAVLLRRVTHRRLSGFET